MLLTYVQVPTIVHPINLYNLQPQPFGITPSPLSYNTASPTPITIPGGPQNYVAPGARRGKRDDYFEESQETVLIVVGELLKRATPTLPNYLATTYPPSRISSGCSCLSVPAAASSTVYQALLSTSIVHPSSNLQIPRTNEEIDNDMYNLHSHHRGFLPCPLRSLSSS